jgi:hypothetical protein
MLNSLYSQAITDAIQMKNMNISTFLRYTKVTDILITGHYWDPGSPKFFSREDMEKLIFFYAVQPMSDKKQNLLVTENQDSFLNIGISGFAVLTSDGVRSNAT